MFRILSFSLLLIVLLASCMKGEHVDLIIHNAQIHTMNEGMDVADAVAIRDGKIIEVGPERQILNKYRSDETIDALGRDVYPGLTDAHGHIFSYANQKMNVDLVGCKSMNEVVYRCEKYLSRTGKKFIVGRGWDQTLFSSKEMPDYKALSEKFKNIPVCLYRIDGHAALVNDFLIKKAGISEWSAVDGGEVQLINGKPSGILLDNAMKLVEDFLPKFSKSEWNDKILEVQQELFQYGVTGVHEAGIEFEQISILKNLIAQNKLNLNIYAMLLPTEKNKEFARKNGPYNFRNLNIRSFKVYADGALGSRGALLKERYADDEHTNGLLLTPITEIKAISNFCLKNGYQMNTHGIGDSAISIILDVCKNAYQVKKDHRFRVEHAQVIDPKDFQKFADNAIFPSVQPTHAVSDCRWAEERIGKKRMHGAYAYRSLLNQFGMIAIGTDFPVESINPFLTIHAAVQRKNKQNEPKNGFNMAEAISLDEVMKGMTIWAAFAEFNEAKRGSIEKGKEATIVIFDKPLTSNALFIENFAWKTLIRGKIVYEQGEL
jgi:predicted amidohydrolase YtcJ